MQVDHQSMCFNEFISISWKTDIYNFEDEVGYISVKKIVFCTHSPIILLKVSQNVMFTVFCVRIHMEMNN